ncbi:cytochrome c [Ferrovibrio sp.]|uniref:c-type cytochrome n=1 Tax=Ferrovibrio sp. TaxID=1917215 RepID=UPI00263449B9|nr:cytochrome c [Ferrovibrio sp.]
MTFPPPQRQWPAWLVALTLAWPAAAFGQNAANPAVSADPVQRGAYVFRAGGCFECHTDTKNKGQPLAGGRGLPTPFGTFFSPNITPDPETGIGRWSEADFVKAMRKGLSPAGENYFPSFPYTAFAKITDADMQALWAYLRAQPPVRQANKPHDVPFPFNLRLAVWGWKLLYFDGKPFVADPAKPAAWNRGAYLVNALGHCGECHTQRNLLGGLKSDRMFAGSTDGAEGKSVPNITPHPSAGISRWSEKDIADFIGSGMTPDGDFTGGLMGDVVAESTKYLTAGDRLAIAVYLKSLPPIESLPRKPQSQ